MLKKTFRRFGALVMVMALAVSVFAVNAFADEVEEEIPATNASVTFDKTIDMVNARGANVPAATFSFQVATPAPVTTGSDVAVAATSNSPEILVGIGSPTIADVTFSYGDTSATKQATVDFSKVDFKHAGIYRYIITESSSTNDDVAIDSSATRYLDVYVVNTDNGGLKIDTYMLLTSASAPTKNTDGKWSYGEAKSAGFTNKYTTYSLTVNKIITGTAANLSEKFNFTIEFEGDAGASFTYGTTTITLDNDGKASQTVALGNGESAEITGIPSNVKYTVTENIDATEGYTTSYKVDNATNATNGTATSEAIMGKVNHTVSFTNDKASTPVTGVITTIAPYALMLVVAGAFAVVFLTRRNRAE